MSVGQELVHLCVERGLLGSEHINDGLGGDGAS